MKTIFLFLALLLPFAALAYEEPVRVPEAPFKKVIQANAANLVIQYDRQDDGGDSIHDYIGVDGKLYLEAVELVRPHYRPEKERYSWRCHVYPKNSTGRLCQRSFRGGNFDSVSYFHFTFFLIEDESGIRMEKNVVNATAYRD